MPPGRKEARPHLSAAPCPLKSAVVTPIGVVAVIRVMMFTPLMVTPFALSLPMPVLGVLAARAAIAPVRLLYVGCLAGGRRRNHGCGRGAKRTQADKAGCGRESNQGLAHGSDLPVRAMT